MELDLQQVMARLNARYSALVQQLIQENAHLEAYVAVLEQQAELLKAQAKSTSQTEGAAL
jgi:serine phosphatase RsbU (regulator of sigma subunit)